MRKDSRRDKPFSRSIVTVFLLATLGSEGMHAGDHSPHTTRRERIEERRRALEEARDHAKSHRAFNSDPARE